MSFDKIILEYPAGWIDSNSDPLGCRHLRCLETLRRAASELNVDFETRNSVRMGDFAQRFAPDGTLLISVHTIGVARNVVRLKESYLPDLYYFDRSGYSGWAELAYNVDLQNEAFCYDLENGTEFVDKMKSDKLISNSSKYQQPSPVTKSTLLPFDKPYIFFALQTSDDLVARLATINQLVLVEKLAEKVSGTKINLVIKRHPMCNDPNVATAIRVLDEKYECVHLSEESINRIMTNSMAVVTVNSGVGFEALVMGVPVITAGRSDYSFMTNVLNKIEDLTELDSMLVKTDRLKVCSALKYYVERYCFRNDDIENAKRLIQSWQSSEYSNMSNMHGYDLNVIRDSQSYAADLELHRRMELTQREKVLQGYKFSELLQAIKARVKNKILES